jgi:hypothetical protein
MTTTSALSRAIQYLGAVEVAPGRWAFKPHKDFQGYLVVGSDALSGIDKRLDIFGTSEAIAHFLGTATRSFVRMPAWWTPEKRFALVEADEVALAYETLDQCIAEKERQRALGIPWSSLGSLVTADLTTGEEMPA